MKKYIILIIVFLLLIIFYLFKKEEIDNILNPNNVKIKVSNNFNFGEISVNDTILHDFYVKNVSNNELTIKNVISNCGCTITDFEKESKKNNDSARVSIKFIPNKVGYVKQNIVLEANTVPPFTILKIEGVIK
jgi:hypothetical protein